MDEADGSGLLPRPGRGGDVLHDGRLTAPERRADAVAQRLLGLLVPHRVDASHLVDDQPPFLPLLLDLDLEELAEQLLVEDRSVAVHDELAAGEGLFVSLRLELVEGQAGELRPILGRQLGERALQLRLRGAGGGWSAGGWSGGACRAPSPWCAG